MSSTWLPFPWERRSMLDICRFSQSMPMFPVEANFRLGEVAEARERSRVRISWVTLFVRAMGLVSTAQPLLRQSYLSWPWPRLYQHPRSVGCVAVARWRGSQPFVAFGRIEQPEGRDLLALQAELDRYCHGDIDSVYREQLLFSRLPTPVRWLAWRILLSGWGHKKARKFGTFGITTLAGQDVLNRRPPGVLSYNLSYGRLDASGRCLVTLLCDHRVIDGLQAAQLLHDLEETLRSRVLCELRELARPHAAAA